MKHQLLEVTDPAFWAAVTPGTHVLRGVGAASGIATVRSTLHVVEAQQLAEWRLFELEPMVVSPGRLWLFMKIVDGALDAYWMETVLLGSRQEVYEECPPLFEERDPAIVSNLADLPYAQQIRDDESGVIYSQKYPPLHGKAVQVPAPSGVGDLFGSVMEYGATVEGCAVPDMVVVEVGQASSLDGGFVRFLRGAAIGVSSLDTVPPATGETR